MADIQAGSDTLRDAYQEFERFEKVTTWSFWISSASFLVYLLGEYCAIPFLKSSGLLIFVCAAVLTVGASAYARYWVAPLADQVRVHQVLGNAYGLETFSGARAGEGFYTSKLSPGDRRLLANVHQSCFFKVRLHRRELATLVHMVIACSVLAGLSLVLRMPKLIEFCWVVLLFSEAVGGKMVRLGRMQAAYTQLLNKLNVLAERYRDGQDAFYEVLAAFVEYETIKARYTLRVSVAHYDLINPEIEDQWQKAAKPLGLLE